jgi:replicative DNA helicase Mcm
MKQVGVDPESGEFDADVINTGSSRTQNNRRAAIRAVLKNAAAPVPFDELVSEVDDFSAGDIRTEINTHFLEKGLVYESEDDVYQWT